MKWANEVVLMWKFKKITDVCIYLENFIILFESQMSVTTGRGAPGLDQVTTQGDKERLIIWSKK